MSKQCPYCDHSRAAHIDEKCALCKCISQPRALVQESLGFRSALPRAV